MKNFRPLLLIVIAAACSVMFSFSAASSPTQITAEKPLRLGLIGLDTSHVTAFTQVLNDAARPDHIPGARVVAAFKGGSPDVESSATRVDKFTAELKDKSITAR